MDVKHKTGFVTIIARPSVGKSSLLNCLIGQKIAITTKTPQTTRRNIKGIYTKENLQIIFIDTPGIHKPINKLGECLANQTKEAIDECDLIIFLADATCLAGLGDKWIVENCLKKTKTPVMLVLNKIDLIKDSQKFEANLYSYKKLFEPQNIKTVKVSAKTGKNKNLLIENIEEYMPYGDKLYDEDEVTDLTMRDVACEIIREKVILNTKEEVPHNVAVMIENYKSEEEIDKISAVIYVATESQKRILIGKKGEMLKKIGTSARLELEEIADKKIFLELFVKVLKNWTKDPKAIKMLGLE